MRVPMIDEDGRSSVLALPPLPSPFHLVAGVLAWDALTVAERLSMLRAAPALKQPPAKAETVRGWLRRHHQSERLCRLFWEPLALAALNQSIDRASAASFVAVVSRMFGGGADNAALLLPAVPLDDLYAQPARRMIEAAGSGVMTHAKAVVTFAADRATGVRVGGCEFPARSVVAAVPWFAFADAVAGGPASLQPAARCATELGSSPIVTVNTWFDRPVLDDAMLGLPGRTFQWAFDRRQLVGQTQSHLSLVSSGAESICAAANEAVSRRAVDELREALPRARHAQLRHVSVVRERRATFSLAPGSPPRPGTISPVPGLYLAGDWIDTGLPATIESACLSGHAAARAVLRAL
jgi:squalene-associated FAD-dependent desaturase